MATSVKKNFAYNSLLTAANYIIPLITYPYVSRVIGVSGIGICGFVDSVVNYFILFSMMGLNIVGVREIAAVGDDREARNRVFTSLLRLNTLTSLIAAAVLGISIPLVPALREHWELMLIGVLRLLSNFLCIEWLYRGLEEFKYITNRTILIRLLYVVAVFILIRRPEDYKMYYFLLTVTITLNAIVNLLYSKKFVSISRLVPMERRLIRPYFIMGLYAILTSMYTTFNTLWLGLKTNPIQVGYYASATKLFSIIIAFFTAFTSVMLPRMSAILSEGKRDEFLAWIDRTLRILFAVAVPLVFFIEQTADDIVRIISGAGFEGAVMPLRTVAPLILIIGLEQVLVIQIMMPQKWDKAIFINSFLGALTGVAGNLLLVSRMQAEGSAIVWLLSELVVFSCSLFVVSRRLRYRFPISNLLMQVLVNLPLVVMLALLYHFVSWSFWGRFGVACVLTGGYFLAVNFRSLLLMIRKC